MNNILDNIGNTPLVEIKNIWKSDKVRIFAKVEGMNPGGSIKDRIAKRMIFKAIERKQLKPGMRVIEATSGNTAIGLAMVCAALGYKCTLFMPDSVSNERVQICRAYGADVVLIEGNIDDAIDSVNLIYNHSVNKNYFYNPNQFDNDDNWRAHYKTTALEICNQLRVYRNYIGLGNPNPTHFVAACGTTGTMRGCALGFKRNYEQSSRFNRIDNTKIIAVFPEKDSKIQGLKNLQFSKVPGIYKECLIDESVFVNDKDAFKMTRRLAKEEGLFCGVSSGAAMAAAVKLAKTLDSGFIVVILPDNGYRYLSEDVFKGR